MNCLAMVSNMAQKRKDFIPLNIKLDKPVAEELEKFTEKTGLSKTATVENALKVYIEQYNKTGKI